MKKKQWLQSLGGVDDKYVAQAAPTGAARKRSGKTVRMISILAACMVFVLLAGTFALFIPYPSTPPSVAAYAGSDYYDIIQKFNTFYFEPPEFKNTFDFLIKLPSLAWEQVEDLAPGSKGEAMDPGDGIYQEVTDNQVAGVIEADLIKRSDKHICYLSNNVLRIYSIEGEDSRLLGSYNVAQYGVESFAAEEFFLSSDCKTVTIISSFVERSQGTRTPYVKVIALDVSDPAAIKEISNTDASGEYLSARMTEHGLLLMTRLRCSKPNYADERTFVPQVEIEGEMQSVAAEDIIFPETLSNASYTVMLMMDATGKTLIDSAAFLSYSEDVYVSRDAIYASRRDTAYAQAQGNEQNYYTVSEISCMGYGAEGFEHRGSVMVDGYVLDQYSMDQYENTLRVFTTTENGTKQINEWGLMPAPITSASLYVIDLDTMQIIASVDRFAPEWETVRSARFDGNTAYVCTAIQQTDPVFMFDLSDLENIEVKETGTIKGFSTSLVNFAEGYLLGIGRGGNGNELKLEIYTEGKSTVNSYCQYVRPLCDYYPDYKCYYIDRENGLVGLGIHTWDKILYEEQHAYSYDNYRYEYIVLHFDGKTITEVLNVSCGTDESLQEMRGVYIDGYYYVLSGNYFEVKPLTLE